MVGVLADLHFAPTRQSKENLLREGKPEDKIIVTGNTAIDALKLTVKKEYSNQLLQWAHNSRLIVLTAHRRENLGEPMLHMFRAIQAVIDKYDDVKMVYPVHLNPLVQKAAHDVFGDSGRVKLVAPMEVVEFHNLLNHAYLILTDSGGIQEEAPSLHKPVVVLRDTTERPEGVAAGTLKLAGTKEEDIFRIVDELLSDREEYERMSRAENPYGDGFASRRIVDALLQWYQSGQNKNEG